MEPVRSTVQATAAYLYCSPLDVIIFVITQRPDIFLPDHPPKEDAEVLIPGHKENGIVPTFIRQYYGPYEMEIERHYIHFPHGSKQHHYSDFPNNILIQPHLWRLWELEKIHSRIMNTRTAIQNTLFTWLNELAFYCSVHWNEKGAAK
jgi:hypothetical protein